MTWYTQSSGGTVVTTGTSYTTSFTSTTTLYVEANDGTCQSNRTPVTATIHNNPVVNLGPPAISITQGTSITLTATPGMTSYLWSNGATTDTIHVSIGGNYSVNVTDANGCHGGDTIVINVIPNGIENNEISDAIEFFPNPTTGKFTVRMSNNSFRFRLYITDVVGQIILTDSHKDNSIFDKEYDLSSYAKGMYFLRVNSENGNTTRTIIIQ